MLKTNVIKHEYKMLVRDMKTYEEKEILIFAESFESAKLKLPEKMEFLKLIGDSQDER